MTTRYEDAISVLGEENKSLVDEIEKEIRMNVNKSEVGEVANLIMRSIEEVENEEIKSLVSINTDGKEVILPVEFEPLKDILKYLEDKSGIKIMENATTDSLNEMLKWISSYFENKSQIEKTAEREDVTDADKKRAVKEYGDVEYADEKNKKYPLDSEKHIRAAYNYIHQKRNADKYSAEDLKKIKNKIIMAWKKEIDPAGPPSAEEKSMENETEVEKCENMEYKPFGGALSLMGAKNYVEAQDLEYKAWRAYSMFGAVAQNIMAGEESVDNKMTAMQTLLTEFKNLLTPQGLETMKSFVKEEVGIEPVNSSVNELKEKLETLSNKVDALLDRAASEIKEVVAEIEKVEEIPAWKSIVTNVEKMLEAAINKTEEERKSAFQDILNETGTALFNLHTSMITPVENVENKSEINIQNMIQETVERTISEKTALLEHQMGETNKMLHALLATKSQINPREIEPKPVSKSIVKPTTPLPQLLRPSVSNKPLSISEIARKSVYNR